MTGQWRDKNGPIFGSLHSHVRLIFLSPGDRGRSYDVSLSWFLQGGIPIMARLGGRWNRRVGATSWPFISPKMRCLSLKNEKSIIPMQFCALAELSSTLFQTP